MQISLISRKEVDKKPEKPLLESMCTLIVWRPLPIWPLDVAVLDVAVQVPRSTDGKWRLLVLSWCIMTSILFGTLHSRPSILKYQRAPRWFNSRMLLEYSRRSPVFCCFLTNDKLRTCPLSISFSELCHVCCLYPSWSQRHRWERS